MMIYAAGAAISLGAFGLVGAGGSRRFWAAAAAAGGAFAIAVSIASRLFDGRNLSVTFLFWFMAGAAPAALAVRFRRLSPWAFAAFAASDLLLAAALTLDRLDTLSWTVPASGSWKGGAAIAAAAALVRLGAPALAADALEGTALKKLRGAGAADGIFLIAGWWQGVFLAGWTGPSGSLPLVVGGFALWGLSCFSRRGRLSFLCLAGGTVAVAAGLGAGHLALGIVALAGAGFAFGETVVAVWAAAAAPLSMATMGVRLDLGTSLPLFAAAVPLALAAMAFRAGVHSPGAHTGVWIAVPLGAVILAGTALQSPAAFAWTAYAAAIAATFAALTTRTGPTPEPPETAFPCAAAFRPVALLPAAGLLSAAGILWARLVLDGLRTGFL